MEMFYLVLAFYNREMTLTTIPEPYTKEQCEEAREDWKKQSISRYAFCIPTSKDYCKYHLEAIPMDGGRYGMTKKVCD